MRINAVQELCSKVSVIVLNYNGKGYVDRCLNSILTSGYPNLELIFVDNNSQDGSWEYAKTILRKNTLAKLIRNSRNEGYARGNNVGGFYARGEYLFFLNIDTEMAPECLQKLVRFMQENPKVGAVQPKLLLMWDRRRLDSCGSYLTPYGFLYHIGLLQEDSGQFARPFEVLSVKGAAFMVKRDLFVKLGGFDADFFSYYEELDLCLRIWLSGYSVWCDPSAIVYHAFGGIVRQTATADMFFFYFGTRNYITALLKNLSLPCASLLSFMYLAFGLTFALYSTFKGRKQALFYFVWALCSLLKYFRNINRKRIQMRNFRKIDDMLILKRFLKRVPLITIWRIASGGAKYGPTSG